MLGFHDDCRVEFCESAGALNPEAAAAAAPRPDCNLLADQIGQLNLGVKAFLEAKWEEPESSCACVEEYVCEFGEYPFSDNDKENQEGVN